MALFITQWLETVARHADRLSLIQLIFLAITLKVGAHHITSGRSRTISTVVGGIVLILYFFHRFKVRDEFPELAETLIRSFLLHQSAASIMDVIAMAALFICRHLRNAWWSMHQTMRRMMRIFGRRPSPPRPTRVPPPPPAPTFQEFLQQFAKQAKAEYVAEMQMLDSLPLDRDEREVLDLHAKQRLLKKLRDRK